MDSGKQRVEYPSKRNVEASRRYFPKLAHSVYEDLDRGPDYGKFMEKDLYDQVKQRKIILYNQVVKMVVLAPKM